MAHYLDLLEAVRGVIHGDMHGARTRGQLASDVLPSPPKWVLRRG